MTLEGARKRLFAYVVDRLGRPEAAKRLGIDAASLDTWMQGAIEPPPPVLLALADLVYEMKKAER